MLATEDRSEVLPQNKNSQKYSHAPKDDIKYANYFGGHRHTAFVFRDLVDIDSLERCICLAKGENSEDKSETKDAQDTQH